MQSRLFICQQKDWERFLKRQEKVDLRYEFYHRAESFINDYDHHETDIFEASFFADSRTRLNETISFLAPKSFRLLPSQTEFETSRFFDALKSNWVTLSPPSLAHIAVNWVEGLGVSGP